GEPLLQFVETFGVARDVIPVMQAIANDDVHQPQGKHNIGAGIDGNVPIGKARSAGAIGIDHHQLGPVAPRLFDERPEMNVVAVNVGGPGDDVLRVTELFGLGPDLAAGEGMRWIALDPRSASVLHRNEHGASVGTIVGTGSVDHLFHMANRLNDYATNWRNKRGSTKQAAEKLCGSLLVEAPCFSRGIWTFSPAEKESILKWALAPGSRFPALKRVIKIELFPER